MNNVIRHENQNTELVPVSEVSTDELLSVVSTLEVGSLKLNSDEYQNKSTVEKLRALAGAYSKENNHNLTDLHQQAKQKAFSALISYALANHGKAAHTNRVFSNHWKAFEGFCWSNGLIAMPADADTVTRYLTEFSLGRLDDNQNLPSISTVKGRVWAIAMMHRYCNQVEPTKDLEVVNKTSALIRELKLQGKFEQQASPIMYRHIQLLIKLWRGGTRKQRRDLALIVTAFTTLMRESELASIRLEDIRHRNDGAISLLLRHSKTAADGEIARIDAPAIAAILIDEYLEVMCIDKNESGFLFRKATNPKARPSRLQSRVQPSEMSPLSGLTIDNIFRLGYETCLEHLLEDVELQQAKAWTGHSSRVGGAIHIALHNKSNLIEVKKKGRWKDLKMVVHYLDQLKNEADTMGATFQHLL